MRFSVRSSDFALFCVAMALALTPLGLAPALMVALAVRLTAHGFLLWRTARSASSAAF